MPAPAARRIGVFPTGSPEWNAARAGRMSGSRIAAACGLNPWESPFALWHRMAGNIGEVEQNDAMRAGNELEPIVINRFGEDYPHIKIIRKPGTWINKARPWQVANPDCLLTLPGASRPARPPDCVFEAKTSQFDTGWGAEWTDQIPIQYYCQTLWYLDTLGLRYCIVGVRFGGVHQRYYLVEYDESTALQLRAIGREFLDSLEAGIAPSLDGQPSTMDTIKELHPEIEDVSVDIPDHIGNALVRSRSGLVCPTERFGGAKAELADFMGTAHIAYWQGQKIADRRSKNGGTPYVQLASNLPAPIQVLDIPREQVSA